MRLQGIVKETQLYGAMVDIGVERNGLVHISQLSPNRVNRVTDVVQPGDSVTVWVTKVEPERGRIGLTMIEPPEVEWRELAEEQTYTGKVTRLESYGAFVDIGAERPGLMHVREMSSGYVRHPSELVQLGDEIEVKILKVDRRKKRIDLTMGGFDEQIEEADDAEEGPTMTAMEAALQRAQSEQQETEDRHEKHQQLDLTEREAILAQTLKLHSKR
jgi:ribosomal protein S1